MSPHPKPISLEEAVQHFAAVTPTAPKLIPLEAAIGHRVASDVCALRAEPGPSIQNHSPLIGAGQRITLTSAFACSVCGITEVLVRKPVVDLVFCASSGVQEQQRLVPMLVATIRAYGAEVGSIEFTGPHAADIAHLMSSSAADIIYVIGGVSTVTSHPAVDAVRSVGELHYHGVRLNPGVDAMFGTVSGRSVIGMKSCVMAMTASNNVLLRPFLRRVFGRPEGGLPMRRAKLAQAITTCKAETTVVFGKLAGQSIEPLGTAPAPLAFAHADSIIVIAEGARRPRPGDHVDYLQLNTIS
jgi:molybdopterin biosynthesis enzyme